MKSLGRLAQAQHEALREHNLGPVPSLRAVEHGLHRPPPLFGSERSLAAEHEGQRLQRRGDRRRGPDERLHRLARLRGRLSERGARHAPTPAEVTRQVGADAAQLQLPQREKEDATAKGRPLGAPQRGVHVRVEARAAIEAGARRVAEDRAQLLPDCAVDRAITAHHRSSAHARDDDVLVAVGEIDPRVGGLVGEPVHRIARVRQLHFYPKQAWPAAAAGRHRALRSGECRFEKLPRVPQRRGGLSGAAGAVERHRKKPWFV